MGTHAWWWGRHWEPRGVRAAEEPAAAAQRHLMATSTSGIPAYRLKASSP